MDLHKDIGKHEYCDVRRLAEVLHRALDRRSVKRAAPECRYVVLNADGRVVLTGAARLREDLTFQIEFDGKLPPSQYDVMVEIVVNGGAMLAQIERIPVVIGGSPASPSH